MQHEMSKQQDHDSSSTEEHPKIAVPYIPPPPPDSSPQRKFRSPLVNGVLLSLVILIGGFMLYNFVGHSLTQTAAVSHTNSAVSSSISPTATPTPTPQ